MKLISKEIRVEMLRRMLLIRRFEEETINLYRGGYVSTCHTSINQEACEVGCIMALRDKDYVVGTHRAHGHPISKGADPARQMAELLGKVTGFNRGKGGSMHMADFEVGCLGENSIVGAGLPIAVGAAVGSLFQDQVNPKVTMVCFGDGASCEGTFHESLNIASLLKAPVIFVCENNGYQVNNAARDVIAVDDIAVRGEYYNIPSFVVDGQDPLACYEVASEAVMRAARREGPTLIECKTMRSRTHGETVGISDGSARSRVLNFVPPEAEYFLRDRDCIAMYKQKLIEDGTMTQEEIDELVKSVDEEMDAAVKFGMESPYPDPSEAYTDVWA